MSPRDQHNKNTYWETKQKYFVSKSPNKSPIRVKQIEPPVDWGEGYLRELVSEHTSMVDNYVSHDHEQISNALTSDPEMYTPEECPYIMNMIRSNEGDMISMDMLARIHHKS